MVRLCWLLCNFHAEVPGTLCAFGIPKHNGPCLWWWSILKVFQHWHGRNLRMGRMLLPQEEWSKGGELGWIPASESWAAWSFLMLISQQGQLMMRQVAKTGGTPALPSLETAANLAVNLAMEQLKIDYSLEQECSGHSSESVMSWKTTGQNLSSKVWTVNEKLYMKAHRK